MQGKGETRSGTEAGIAEIVKDSAKSHGFDAVWMPAYSKSKHTTETNKFTIWASEQCLGTNRPFSNPPPVDRTEYRYQKLVPTDLCPSNVD